MLTPEAFNHLVQRIAELNNLDQATAAQYAAYIGDTPEIASDGKVIVRDEHNNVLFRLDLGGFYGTG